MARRGRPKHEDVLTPREWEVLALLREELTNDQIAERLSISPDGAKYHVSEILSKLGVESREEAAAWEPREARIWWRILAPLPLIAKAAGAGLVMATIGGLGVLTVAQFSVVRSDEHSALKGTDLAYPTPQPISLQGLTPEIAAELQNSYTILMVPEGDRATVTPADATEKALAEGGGTPLETVLARYVDNGTTPPQDRLVWVVNVDPASVPWYAYATAPVVFYIRVIDAKTGEYVFGYGHRGNCSQVPAKAAGCGTYAPALDTAPSP
jgi:DNA-binding CsgD family transcriptional regulator